MLADPKIHFFTDVDDHPVYGAGDTFAREERNELKAVDNVVRALMEVMQVEEEAVGDLFATRPDEGWFAPGTVVDLTDLDGIVKTRAGAT